MLTNTTPDPSKPSPATLLLIDDDPDNLEILTLDLEQEGYILLTATDGQAGWDLLRHHAHAIDAILLDRMMPGMDGITFIHALHAEPESAAIPVIMQTALAERKQVEEGLAAGVYYYLTKPYDVHNLRAIVRGAVAQYQLRREIDKQAYEQAAILKRLHHACFHIQKPDEARQLSRLLAHCFPQPRMRELGILEILTNAIEHGNLGIGYEEKSRLLKENRWEEEIAARLVDPACRDKWVTVTVRCHAEATELEVCDEGPGFDWQPYLHLDPARATHSHGRGIAMSMAMSFDEVGYQDAGNRVVCRVHHRSASNPCGGA